MSGKNEGVHLFSNGSEFEWWTERNCTGCIVKIEDCKLINAMFDDPVLHDLPHGNVTQRTADRLGYSTEYLGVLGWPCKARKTVADPRPSEASKAMRDMRRTGAVELPGFEAVPVAETRGVKPWTA